MFSPVRAITAGALVFALGGVLLIAQPFDQQGGSLPGAATDADAVTVAMEPAMVTGTATMLSYDSDGTMEFLDNGATLQSGVRITHEWEASDPRLSGTSVFISNWQRYGAANLQVDRTIRVVENDDGRWVGTGTDLWGGDGNKNTETVILHGEGAYEGLTAYVIMAWDPPSPPQATFEAAIFPGEMPPFPELPDE